jgi:hypothetical protein
MTPMMPHQVQVASKNLEKVQRALTGESHFKITLVIKDKLKNHNNKTVRQTLRASIILFLSLLLTSTDTIRDCRCQRNPSALLTILRYQVLQNSLPVWMLEICQMSKHQWSGPILRTTASLIGCHKTVLNRTCKKSK